MRIVSEFRNNIADLFAKAITAVFLTLFYETLFYECDSLSVVS